MKTEYDRKWFFDNGYGASVIRHKWSMGYEDGLYELAVIKGTPDSWKITYNTPITDDVVGCLTPREVVGYLKRIKNLAV